MRHMLLVFFLSIRGLAFEDPEEVVYIFIALLDFGVWSTSIHQRRDLGVRSRDSGFGPRIASVWHDIHRGNMKSGLVPPFDGLAFEDSEDVDSMLTALPDFGVRSTSVHQRRDLEVRSRDSGFGPVA
ncbi:hypothetical protein DFH09DRAFT_1100875 [Mycena vulgaris]|nr:hypothetical protein DFH09DRAFT_1100875 [Mycena vulgaris]